MSQSSLRADEPFSRPLNVASVGEDAMPVTIVAEPAERAALARRDGLIGIEHLQADLSAVREGRSGLRVTGTVKAAIRQTCVVSLEPFEAEIVESFDVHFLPESDVAALEAARPKGDEAGEPDADLPDAIVGGRVDLGALAAEFFALGLDPHPRKPGAAYAGPQVEDAETVSPFAALSRIRIERSV